MVIVRFFYQINLKSFFAYTIRQIYIKLSFNHGYWPRKSCNCRGNNLFGRKRSIPVTFWLARRETRGIYNNLVRELRLEDEEEYKKLLRMDAEIFDEHSLRSVCFFCLCSKPSTKYSNIVVRSFNFKRKIWNNKSKKLSTSEFLKMEKVTKLFRKSVRFFWLRYQIFNHIFYFRLICQINLFMHNVVILPNIL